jgi:calcium-dependent phosphoinositide phospholipase C
VRIRTLAALPVAALLAAAFFAGTAPASADTGPTLAQATTVGVHNTYDQAAYPYLATALDSGASMIELDVWDDVFTKEWKVSHDSLTSNSNNCVAATSASQLYTGGANKDLEQCLDDVRLWLGAHPGHAPLTIKLEMKAGFQNNLGLGPAKLDSSIATHLGNLVFKPADLLAKPGGGTYASLDDAAKADNWPSRSALAGKVMIEIIPGTVEESNPTDTLWTDVEYAQYLKGLAAAGTLAQAQVFPAVHNAQAGDPRTRYSDTTLRPWFVVFDGDAATYVNGIDTSWYDTNHYYLIMTDAQNVSPAIDDANPTLQQAQDRVAQLAADHASVVSCDWTGLPQVLSEVLTRG